MRFPSRRWRSDAPPALFLVLLLSWAAEPAALSAQSGRPTEPPSPGTDSVTVVAGARYDVGDLHTRLLGADYRDLWTTPIRVAVLDFSSFAGGLEIEERGGGMQTKSLRLRGADGREYVFRSVDKYPYLSQTEDLKDTRVGDVIQDQTASLNPAGALVAARLLEAAGVLHADPQLVVMPDDPVLGEFREEFAGMLGLIEERPNEEEDDEPGFAGSDYIVGTERFLEIIEEEPEAELDSRAYLRARLMDLLLGDWDRHADQWRWASFERGGRQVWLPIPRDRDYAFVNYDGFLLDVLRSAVPNVVAFDEEYGSLAGLTYNAQNLDSRLLADLPRPVWDSVAIALTESLSDSVIRAAVEHLPRPYYELRGAEFERVLQARRDDLPRAAAEFYRQLAAAPEIHTTDEDELALVERDEDGSVDVKVFFGETASGEPFFQRRFTPDETSEIRLFLHGGDDRAVVRGEADRSVVVRIVGGGGDDVLVDSSRVGGFLRRGTAFYDDRGDNRFVTGPDTRVDRRPYEAPANTEELAVVPFRDFGSSWSVRPRIGYRSEMGVILGGGPVYTRYGFRSEPYAYQLGIQSAVAIPSGAWELGLWGDWRRANSRLGGSARADVSNRERLRFFGFGNDTEVDASDRTFLIDRDQVMVGSSLNVFFSERHTLSVGPVVKWTDTDGRPGSPLELGSPYGNESFGQVGAQAGADLDYRDHPLLPRRGGRIQLGGSVFPPVWDAIESFGEAHAEATGYLTAPVPSHPTLALRVGAKRVWGTFPIHEAAFVGGSRSLRGYPTWRLAGDAALWSSAELRASLFRAKLLVRGDLGGLLLTDVGRVYLDGESPGGWHTAVGAGLWFAFRFRDQPNTFSAVVAHGDDPRLYVRLGLPF